MKWETVKLYDILDLKNGFAFKSDDYVEKSKTLNCRMSNIRPGGYFDINYNAKYLPDSYVDKYSEYLLKDGDLIVAMTDLANDPKILGVPTIVKTEGKNILLNQRVGKLVLKNKKSICIRYLKYALNRKEIQQYFGKFAGGGLQINLGKSDLLSCQIPLPPLHIQEQIADTLDKADALRRKDQELLQKYDQLAQAIFYDMFGDPVRNERGWQLKKLEEIIYPNEKISYGIVQPGDEDPKGVPVIRVGDFENMVVKSERVKRVSANIESKYKKTRLIGDELLIACVGSIGKIALVDKTQAGFNIVRATARIRPNQLIVNRVFLAVLLSMPKIQEYFTKETRTVSQPTLNISHIASTMVALPPIKKQETFSNIFISMQKQKQLISQQTCCGLFETYSDKYFHL